MKKNINLNNLIGIPKIYIDKLEKHKKTFLDNEFLEHILEGKEINQLVKEINEVCLKASIYGFHYTRAIPEHIIEQGLRCRTGEEIRQCFINNHGNLLSSNELETVLQTWNKHFDYRQKESRDNYLFFNFTTSALYNGGAEPLLVNFGGEQIYMPIFEMDSISAKINNLGIPMILKCTLNPNKINTFYEYPWGKIAVSTFHALCNPKACRLDQDGYQSINVQPTEIEMFYYDSSQDFRLI